MGRGVSSLPAVVSVLSVVSALVWCASCAAERPPPASTGEEADASSAPASEGGTFSAPDAGAALNANCPKAAACSDGCCAFQPFLCDTLDTDSSLGALYQGGGVATPPLFWLDTKTFRSPPASLALSSQAGAAIAMRFESITTLAPGHPVQVSFTFRVDADPPPPEIARFEYGRRTTELRIVDNQIQLFVHARVEPWYAPFTDNPRATGIGTFVPHAWTPIATDIGADVASNDEVAPLSIVLGSTVAPSTSGTLRFDDLVLTHLPCRTLPDAGVDASASDASDDGGGEMPH